MSRPPPPGAAWEDIERFALSLQIQLDEKQRAEIAASLSKEFDHTQRVHAPLEHLEAALWLEQRGWRHHGAPPDGQSMQYLRALVAGIGKARATPRQQ